jgi:hypothetical protein
MKKSNNTKYKLIALGICTTIATSLICVYYLIPDEIYNPALIRFVLTTYTVLKLIVGGVESWGKYK